MITALGWITLIMGMVPLDRSIGAGRTSVNPALLNFLLSQSDMVNETELWMAKAQLINIIRSGCPLYAAWLFTARRLHHSFSMICLSWLSCCMSFCCTSIQNLSDRTLWNSLCRRSSLPSAEEVGPSTLGRYFLVIKHQICPSLHKYRPKCNW